ncbi:MAG: hypothetical protein KJN84_05860, partial [Bacteroidia bacterium]|nr:hypothetical protein [Bacteroidia bacterium]
YWDLHVDVKDDIPKGVKEIARAFNTVLAIANPVNPKNPAESISFMKNYLAVRKLRKPLQVWLQKRIDDVKAGKVKNPKKTFVYYWLENAKGERGNYFDENDIVFECFHNFLAFNQFGNTIYMIMQQFSGKKKENKMVQDWFAKTMNGNYDKPVKGSTFSPLDLFVMELFRTLSPNGGSISNVASTSAFESHLYVTTPHKETSDYYVHWEDADTFNPNRYLDVPTSAEVDEKKSKKIGFAQCPFHKSEMKALPVKEKTKITNSAFGTVYGVTNGQPAPVCDYAGYAPFGFGYRRCPGELFNIELIKDFLRKVWDDKISFKVLRIKDPQQVPVAPGKFVPDNIGFSRP